MFQPLCSICQSTRCNCGHRHEQVGTTLSELIPKQFKSEDCGCLQYAKAMDSWGVKGCEARFESIVDHLVDQARKHHLPKVISEPIARRWLRKAIDQNKPKR